MQIILASLVAVALAILLYRRYINSEEQQKRYPHELFAPLVPLLENAKVEATETIGTNLLTGNYNGFPVQIKTIVDTLSTRKLPSLWLMITIPLKTAVPAVFNIMMRPTGPSTFSNFDNLPHTIPTPAGFPLDAVLRSDSENFAPPVAAMRNCLKSFAESRSKELLITPKGVRIVLQAAEATRARYGVFRQADFGDVFLNPELVKETIDLLVQLHSEISGTAP